MQIELNVTQSLINKIRALNALLGQKPSSLEETVLKLMEDSVTERLRFLLDMHDSEPAGYYKKRQDPIVSMHKTPYDKGFTDLSDGLGDLDESEPEPVESMFDLVPEGGLSDKSIEDDMKIEDPEHEAKAEAPEVEAVYGQATDLFSKLSGIPLPVDEEEEIDARILKRKKKVKHRAKVSAATGDSGYDV